MDVSLNSPLRSASRILKKSVYSHFVEWREDGVLLIHDIKALETTAFIHGVYIGHGGYPSIARQLRVSAQTCSLTRADLLMAFFCADLWLQSITREKIQRQSWYQSLEARESCKLLVMGLPSPPISAKTEARPFPDLQTSTCSLLDVREYKRRAKPKGHNKRPPKTNETVIGLSRSCPSSSPCLEGLHSALPSSTDELQGPVSDVPGWSEPADQEHQDDGSSGKSFEEAFEDIAAIASGPEALDVMQEEIEKLTADIFAYLKEYS